MAGDSMLVCPKCLRRITEELYRCRGCGKNFSRREIELSNSGVRKSGFPSPKIKKLLSFNLIPQALEWLKCPECSYLGSGLERPTFRRICQYADETDENERCEYQFPRPALELKKNWSYNPSNEKLRRIALVGAHDSGKTHFIPMMVQVLNDSEDNRFLMSPDENCSEIFNKYYKQPLLDEKRVLDSTRRDVSDTNVLDFWIRKPSNSPDRSPHLITFRDDKGEEFNYYSDQSRSAPYYLTCDNYLIMVDVRYFFENKYPGRSREFWMPPEIFRSVKKFDLNRFLDVLLTGQTSQKSVAICITMSDLLWDALADPTAVRSLRGAGIDIDRHSMVFKRALQLDNQTRLRLLCVKRMEEEIDQLLSIHPRSTYLKNQLSHFGRHQFFFTSFTGCSPIQTGSSDHYSRGYFPRLSPIRILDPIDWLLHSGEWLPH